MTEECTLSHKTKGHRSKGVLHADLSRGGLDRLRVKPFLGDGMDGKINVVTTDTHDHHLLECIIVTILRRGGHQPDDSKVHIVLKNVVGSGRSLTGGVAPIPAVDSTIDIDKWSVRNFIVQVLQTDVIVGGAKLRTKHTKTELTHENEKLGKVTRVKTNTVDFNSIRRGTKGLR
jgi:hypothetical protein